VKSLEVCLQKNAQTSSANAHKKEKKGIKLDRLLYICIPHVRSPAAFEIRLISLPACSRVGPFPTSAPLGDRMPTLPTKDKTKTTFFLLLRSICLRASS